MSGPHIHLAKCLHAVANLRPQKDRGHFPERLLLTPDHGAGARQPRTGFSALASVCASVSVTPNAQHTPGHAREAPQVEG